MKRQSGPHRSAAGSLTAVVAILTGVASPCTGNTLYRPTSQLTGGVGVYSAFPGPYAAAYLYQPIFLTNPGFLSTPVFYNYVPAFPAQAPVLIALNGSSVVEAAAAADKPAGEGTPAFKFAIGRVEARAELFGQATAPNFRGYVYFATDAAVKGTTVLSVGSGPTADGILLLAKVGSSTNCQNAQATEIFNPSSVTGGGRLYSWTGPTGPNNGFSIERSVPEDIVSLTGSRSIIGRTVLVTLRNSDNPNGVGPLVACGVIVRV